MAQLLVDQRDVKFILYEQLQIQKLCEMPLFSEYSQDMFDMVLDQARKLAENEFYPANRIGDREGVVFEEGHVKVPQCFHKPYRLYKEGGWLAISDPAEVGGQGFPFVVGNAAIEFFSAANWALMMYPGLTHGAARLLEKYGTPEQQELYMFKLFSGEWGGTMCLTEPNAGTDVGALRTKATRRPDGSFNITGQKIFISSGAHDLTENIVHMVLARIEGAPKGTKGISIFIVPRYRYGGDGSLVDNDVVCTNIEEKLGIHASSTCGLSFGDENNCIGYLLGQENKGMRIMFEMMNEARHFVGMQGLSLGSAAYLHALNYAKERLQGCHFTQLKNPEAPRVPIIEHPDVRRMLMFMKSTIEGVRALLYYAAYCMDRAQVAETEEERDKFQGYVDILIPVCKAYGSDMGFRVCETAIQVYGGYGYCTDCPVEQYLRDCKIASIYEGTNGIQALDLVGRKIALRRGLLFKNILGEIERFIEWVGTNYGLKEPLESFIQAKDYLIECTKFFALKGMTDEFVIPILYAKPYLELFGDVAVGLMLLWQAAIADQRLQEIYQDGSARDAKGREEVLRRNPTAAFYQGKIASARFFANNVLSLAGGKAKAIMSGEKRLLDIPDNSFALP